MLVAVVFVRTCGEAKSVVVVEDVGVDAPSLVEEDATFVDDAAHSDALLDGSEEAEAASSEAFDGGEDAAIGVATSSLDASLDAHVDAHAASFDASTDARADDASIHEHSSALDAGGHASRDAGHGSHTGHRTTKESKSHESTNDPMF